MSKFKKTDFKKAIQRNIEKQAKEAQGYGYLNLPKGTSLFKEREGKMYLDFIPYIVKTETHPDREEGIAEAGSLWYKFPFKTHRNVGAKNDTVVCPTTFGKKCPICEYKKKRAQEGAEWEELKAFNPSKRNLYAVIPIGDKKMEEKIFIWDVSHFLFQELLNKELQENDDHMNFPALEGGKTLYIRFEEQAIGKNKFNEAKRIDFEKRKEDYDDSIIDEVPCLEELLITLSYKEIEALMFEIDAEDVEDTKKEDSEEEIKKPVRKKVIEKAEESDDEEEQEEAPVRKRKPVEEEEEEPAKPIRKKVVEEEEEEEIPKEKKEAPKPVAKAKAGKTCPHGHEWGEADNHKECGKCEVWDDCIEG